MTLSLIFMIVGFAGCAASFVIPHERNFSADHAVGAGLTGVTFLLMCFILAMVFALN